LANNPLIQLTPFGVAFVFFGGVVAVEMQTKADFGPLGDLAWLVVLAVAIGLAYRALN
jgi:hypothetical protein